jgi:hypothetical protein
MDKARITATIKEWVRMDSEIADLRRQIKEFTLQKKTHADELVRLMKEFQIDEIDMTDGKIVRQTRRTKAPVNKKLLLASLAKYYKNENTAKELSEFILSERVEKTMDCIKKK